MKKSLCLTLAFFFSTIVCSQQIPTTPTKPLVENEAVSLAKRLSHDRLQSLKEMRQSLERVIALDLKGVDDAEQKVATAKVKFKEGLIFDSTVQYYEGLAAKKRSDLQDERKELAETEIAIQSVPTDVEIEKEQEQVARDMKRWRYRAKSSECQNWTLTASRKTTTTWSSSNIKMDLFGLI